MFKNFSRASVNQWVVAILGLLTTIGVDLPVEEVAGLVDAVFSDIEVTVQKVVGIFMTVSAAVTLWYRKIASGPLANGIAGFFGKRA